ncbi:MAG: 50S ribosomal protein L10 [Proteobacteria bacterium]|nr:50S ribosomal protein L10 [Pseudomonadota bacterium]
MNRTQKAEQVAEIKDRFGRMACAVLTDFRGLDVESINKLRREFDKINGIEYKVVKNTLIKRAIKKEDFADNLDGHLIGPTAIVWSYEDPVAPAKVVVDFAKENDKLKVKCAVLDGQVLDEAGVKQLSSMPGKDEIKAKLLATFMAPASNMVRLLVAAPTSFLNLMEARRRELDD